MQVMLAGLEASHNFRVRNILAKRLEGVQIVSEDGFHEPRIYDWHTGIFEKAIPERRAPDGPLEHHVVQHGFFGESTVDYNARLTLA